MNKLSSFITQLRSSPKFGPGIVHADFLPARPAALEPASSVLGEPLGAALKKDGLANLYSHQAEALRRLREKNSVGITTPTASGKTLVYNLAVAESLLADPAGHSLYLFPLKALAQDQLKTLRSFLRTLGMSPEEAAMYDGDTPASTRARLKRNLPRIVFSNPDMLHYGMLAFPDAWTGFFQNLRTLVIDEAHTYRGVFGSNVSLVLRRLLRLCGEPGPRLVASSATMANAGEFLNRLTGRDFFVVDENGAPREGRHVLLVEPSGSPYSEAAAYLQACLEQGLKTILFTKSRKIAELIHMWVRESAPAFATKIAAYRSGYLPEERREIERRLFENELEGVISTSALESGIDVGGLDACILVGYPGTMISTWQRAGRAGRGGRESLMVLIALPDALDHYLLRHPHALLKSKFENCVLDPGNREIAAGHLICASAESPLAAGDARWFDPEVWSLIPDLVRAGSLRENAEGGRWFAGRSQPHRGLDIRSTGEQFTIRLEAQGKILGTIDGARVFKECHPGAVYLHSGQTYEVTALEMGTRVVVVRAGEVDWYTQYTASEEIEILGTPSPPKIRPSSERFQAGRVQVRVTEKIVAYERRRVRDQSLISEHKLDLPPRVFETQAVLLTVPAVYRGRCREFGLDFSGGLHAMEHVLIASLPVHVLCDRWDLGGLSCQVHPQVDQACIFIYDGFPGGVGLAGKGVEVLPAWLNTAWEMVSQCGCESGCPACVHSPKCGSRNQPLDKDASRMLLKAATLQDPLPLRLEAEQTPRGLETPAPSPAAPAVGTDYRLLVFDLETQRSAEEVGGWHRTDQMGLSLGVVYDTTEKKFTAYREPQAGELIQRLLAADRVVGFNIDKFDLTVLSAYSSYVNRIRTFDLATDIFQRLGHRVSLDTLARATLGQGKTAEGLQAIAWFRQGNWRDLEAYCRADVAITRDLFFFGLRYRYVLYERKGEVLKLPVEWHASFPPELFTG